MAVAILLAVVAILGMVSSARAGTWMQVSCTNPDGSSAPSEGWSGGPIGAAQPGGYAQASCTASSPLATGLSQLAPAPTGDEQALTYTPPPGSTLAGGRIQVHLYAGGYGTTNGQLTAVTTAALSEPTISGSDAFFQCVAYVVVCNHGSGSPLDYSGPVTLPANRGGTLHALVMCSGSGANCDNNAAYASWALAQISSADLLLSSSVSPGAGGFSGSAVQPRTRGLAHLLFTATDPGGPGVYRITAAIDGFPVYAGTPDNNAGKCAPVGTDPSSGALMFDWQQPCLQSENVDIPVPTAGQPDGGHELSVTVTDAAGNASTVFDQTISTANPQLTPRGHGRIRAQFVISWRWTGAHTTMRSIAVRGLPRGASIAVSCRGRHCPRLRPHTGRGRAVRTLLRSLGGRRYAAGDRILITIARGRRRERVALTIRNGRVPAARLLRP